MQILRVKACIFADRFLAPEFARVMRYRLVLRLLHCETAQWRLVVYAFENLPEGDSVLQLLVDLQCYKGEIEVQSENELPRSSMLRAMRRYAHWRDCLAMVPEPRDCDYHDHDVAEERRKCKGQVKKELSYLN